MVIHVLKTNNKVAACQRGKCWTASLICTVREGINCSAFIAAQIWFIQEIKLLETGAVSIWGVKKKELRAETTVVQTNRLMAASVTHTCAGAGWSQPASVENVTWQRSMSHESKCCVCMHRACCWQAAPGKGPLWSALRGGLSKGLCEVFTAG